MGYSLRDQLEDLRKHGELIEINEEVDWNLEVAAFGHLLGRVEAQTPALLFNKIKGYPKGYRLVTGIYIGSWRQPYKRFSIALGIDPSKITREQYAREFSSRMAAPLKPIEVATGPCKEVKKFGKEVNLFDFPFPYYSMGDGARYSFNEAIICKDPDSDWVNWGMYATALNSRNRVTFSCHVGAQMATIFVNKYEARNQSMPVAIAVGVEPAIFWAAGLGAPPGMSEADAAGGLRQAPIELVRAETSDLLVPADAEIILEGEMRPHERLPEGPKTEAWWFQAGPRRPTYVARINCITHRKDPILPLLPQDFLGDVQSWIYALDFLGSRGREGVKSSGSIPYAHDGYSSSSIKKDYLIPGFVRDFFESSWSGGMAAHMDHHQLVDDDVDCLDMEQVAEASFTQVNPKRDFWITDGVEPKTLAGAPYADDIDWERYAKEMSIRTTKQTVDCTTKGNPVIRRTAFEYLFPEHLQKWVVDNWKRLGFEEEPRWNLPYIKRSV